MGGRSAGVTAHPQPLGTQGLRGRGALGGAQAEEGGKCGGTGTLRASYKVHRCVCVCVPPRAGDRPGPGDSGRWPWGRAGRRASLEETQQRGRGPAPRPPRSSPMSPQVQPHSPRSRFLLLQLQRLQPVGWGGVRPGRGWHRVSPQCPPTQRNPGARPRGPGCWGGGRQGGPGQAAAAGALRAQSQGLFRVEQPCSPGNRAWESRAQESLPPRPAPAGEGPAQHLRTPGGLAQRPPHPSVSLCSFEAPQNPSPLSARSTGHRTVTSPQPLPKVLQRSRAPHSP